jgi:hypothetical protein
MVFDYIFGCRTGETPETLARRREIQDSIAAQILGHPPTTALGGLGSILSGLALGYARYRDGKTEDAGRKSALDALQPFLPDNSPGTATTVANSTSVPSVPGSMTNARNADRASLPGYAPSSTAGLNANDIYNSFMGTVRNGLTNPYALAAVASTANAESSFSPGNANRTWNDPGAGNAPGTAGGIMSWRNDRLKNLYAYAAAKGEKPGAISPETQAEFFLGENPKLIAALQSARSVDEAQSLMNNAWRFRGYDQPGGEAARRLQMANAFLQKFQTADAATPGQARTPGTTEDNSVQANDTSNILPTTQTLRQPANPYANVDPGLIKALFNPWLTPEQKAIVQAIINQQAQNADPAHQLELRKSRAEVKALEHLPAKWEIVKGNDGAIYRVDPQTGHKELLYGPRGGQLPDDRTDATDPVQTMPRTLDLNSAPQGIDPATWGHLTPAEKQKFLDLETK